MKKVLFNKAWVFAFFLLICSDAEAANKYWYGATNTTFSTATNWSTSNTSYVAAAAAPGNSDNAMFGNYTGMTNANCNLTTAIDVKNLKLESGYTGTVTANTGSLTHNIGSSGFDIAAGTFTITTGTTITNAGNFTFSGGTFSVNLSATVTVTFGVAGNFNQTGGTFSSTSFSGSTVNVNVGGDMTSSAGTFTAGNSTFKLNKGSTGTLTGSPTFNNLTFNPGSTMTWTINSSPTVNGLLQYTNSSALTLNGSGTLNAKGDITIASTLPAGGGGAITLAINGTGTQVLTGNASAGNGCLPNVSIACSTLRVVGSGTTSVAGNWTYTSGTIDCNFSSSNSNIAFVGTGNIDGQGTSSTMTFQNVTIFASGTTPTRTLTGNLVVNRNLTINSGITLATGVTSTSNYNINIGGTWSDAGTFTHITTPSSTVTFDGTTYYGFVSKTSATETFTNLAVNKSSGGLICAGPVNVTASLTLTAGKVKTTSTNILSLAAGTSLTGGSNTAYVNGPLKKSGNTSFTFPVGDSSVASTPYHPLAMTAPTHSGDAFTAQYIASGQTSGSAKASTIASLSSCEYWTLVCNALGSSSSTVTPTLNWNGNCANTNYSEMVVAKWSGTQWDDLGAGTVNGTAPAGSIAASTALTYTVAATSRPLLIAKKDMTHSYATLSKQVTGNYYNTNGNVLYFVYEEEYKDGDGFVSYQVLNAATNAPVTLYANPSTSSVPVNYGTNFYKMDLYTAANTPLTSGMYLLVITNDKNETWQLLFNKN